MPPSIVSKAENILNWVSRFTKLTPITQFTLETAKFDVQKLENPDIQGKEYQQGRLFGYADKKAYLLERENHRCIYCGIHASQDRMEIEHVVPKSKGGTDSLNNLVLSCRACNQAKGNQEVQTFLKNKPSVLRRVKNHLSVNYRDAAHTNSIRLYVMNKLRDIASTMGALNVGFGSTTKQNRLLLGLPKDHWIDAAVCTENGNTVQVCTQLKPLVIKAIGRGSRQFCRMDKYGFPRTSPKPRSKNVFGFKTYDMVKVVLPETSKYAGVHTGRIAVRSSGYFDIVKPKQKINFHHRYAKLVQQADGYVYE